MNNEEKQIQVIFFGDIQAVGFRFFVKELANKLAINGYVKNLDDGSVEVIAVGDQTQLEAFLIEIIEKAPGRISKTSKKFTRASQKFSDFQVRF